MILKARDIPVQITVISPAIPLPVSVECESATHVAQTLYKCRRACVESSKDNAFLEDPTQVHQYFWSDPATM